LDGGSPGAQEKIYSLFLKGLAETTPGSHNHGQAIACQPPHGLSAGGFCWKERPIQIKVKGSNFMNTEVASADLNTIIENQKIIKENQEIIKANQEKLDAILANQEAIQANQTKILANQSEIISLLSK
jgi:uncharacterized protein HemX